ncbi:nucleotidyltransferase domain-containing protein [Candidatus Woesearchaeota archaeon]|nr:nucleotidyltransferase domain-containing protein [Candidatus Woesearchaeota archaeon]
MLQKKDKGNIPFFRESSFKVAELIFNFPNKTFHIREIAKETGLSTTAVTGKHSLKELHESGIIKLEKTNLTTNVRANMESDAYRFYKKIFNLYRLERYAVIEKLKEGFQAEAIVLFGSFAKGEDAEESDIDILIITNRKEDEISSDFLKNWEKTLNRKISLQVLPSLQKSSKEFKNAVANGIVLDGYLKVL